MAEAHLFMEAIRALFWDGVLHPCTQAARAHVRRRCAYLFREDKGVCTEGQGGWGQDTSPSPLYATRERAALC
eukprot:2064463-Rhodomonas_salina.1